MEDTSNLRKQLRKKEAELLQAQLALIETKISRLEQNHADQETRLRTVESARVRFETLTWVAFGGGALSLINVITVLVGKL